MTFRELRPRGWTLPTSALLVVAILAPVFASTSAALESQHPNSWAAIGNLTATTAVLSIGYGAASHGHTCDDDAHTFVVDVLVSTAAHHHGSQPVVKVLFVSWWLMPSNISHLVSVGVHSMSFVCSFLLSFFLSFLLLRGFFFLS